MLAIGVGRFAGELLIGSKHGAQCIEDVLPSLLAGAALAQGARHLENARDNPPVLVGAVERNREVDRCGDAETVARNVAKTSLVLALRDSARHEPLRRVRRRRSDTEAARMH